MMIERLLQLKTNARGAHDSLTRSICALHATGTPMINSHSNLIGVRWIRAYWRSIPPVRRRASLLTSATNWAIGILLIPGLGFLVLGAFRIHTSYAEQHIVKYFIPGMIVLMVMIGTLYVIIETTKPRSKTIKKYRYRICGQCGYAVTHHGRLVQCPECGMQYDLRHLVQFWMRWLHPWRSIRRLPALRPYFIRVNAIALAIIFAIFATLYVLTFDVPHAVMITSYGVSFAALSACTVYAISQFLFLFGTRLKQYAYSDSRRCPRCCTELNQSGVSHYCGTCGKHYTDRSLRRLWRNALPPHWERDVITPSREAWEAQQPSPNSANT